MFSVETCNCQIYPLQVSLALPPPPPQGQSTAPCLHCWQVSKSLAAGCSCARHRDRGKGRNDCLQPGTHKQFKLKGLLFVLREDLKVPLLRYHQSVTASLFSAEFIGSSLFYFVWLIPQPASSTFTLQVLFKETDVWKLLNECLWSWIPPVYSYLFTYLHFISY